MSTQLLEHIQNQNQYYGYVGVGKCLYKMAQIDLPGLFIWKIH